MLPSNLPAGILIKTNQILARLVINDYLCSRNKNKTAYGQFVSTTHFHS